MTKNIMIVGVGGQGTLLTSRIIGKTALEAGYDVKISEVHGMAQRGGSVVTFVRFGEKVHEPVVEEGDADVIIAFERLEALRYAKYLKDGGVIVTGEKRIDPMPVITGAAEYPSEIGKKLAGVADVTLVDALALAKEAGNIKSLNVALIGVLAKNSEIAHDKFVESIKKCVPAKFLEANLKAFELGYGI